MTVLTSSTILSGAMNISEATTSSQEDKTTQQQLQEQRQQQRIAKQQQQEQQQDLQTQAVQTQALSEKKPITTADIADNAVTSPKIKDGEVKTPDLATAAVTKPKLDPNAVKLVVIERLESALIDPNSLGDITASCNSGEVVTGGGFASSKVTDNFIVSERAPNGWRILVSNPSTTNTDVHALVECAHLELGP